MTEDPDDSRPLRDLQRLRGCACRDCARVCCGHEIVASLVLGFADAPRCLPCLARGLRREIDELRDDLIAHVRRRECFLRAWRAADDDEGTTASPPACLVGREVSLVVEPVVPSGPSIPQSWDAGDLACGELLMLFYFLLRKRPPRSVIKITARDASAPHDLPAWCRLTGHALIEAAHPEYLIRRKEN